MKWNHKTDHLYWSPYNLSSTPLNASTDSIASNIMSSNSLVQHNPWQKMHRTTKIRTWAFFPLVKQQHITKTISIFWNTQSKKEEEKDKCFGSTKHWTLLFIFSPALLHCWHHRHPQTRETKQHHINPKNYHSFIKWKPWLKKHSQVTAHTPMNNKRQKVADKFLTFRQRRVHLHSHHKP